MTMSATTAKIRRPQWPSPVGRLPRRGRGGAGRRRGDCGRGGAGRIAGAGGGS